MVSGIPFDFVPRIFLVYMVLAAPKPTWNLKGDHKQEDSNLSRAAFQIPCCVQSSKSMLLPVDAAVIEKRVAVVFIARGLE